jgi:hypothetical protein
VRTGTNNADDTSRSTAWTTDAVGRAATSARAARASIQAIEGPATNAASRSAGAAVQQAARKTRRRASSVGTVVMRTPVDGVGGRRR